MNLSCVLCLTKLDENHSLEYQRPQSLEEAPAREVGSFMKENRMDNMMSADMDSMTDKNSKGYIMTKKINLRLMPVY